MSTRKPTKKTRRTPARVPSRPAAALSPTVPRVVGIGASAGGLEAFNELLLYLPERTGMAFVLVQHLSPDHESNLASLLSRATPLPVVEARDGERLQPDHVYVIPPGVLPALRDGVLRFTRRPRGPGLPRVIDHFLGSLARELGPRAVGVVLSGTGSDGTRGLMAIQTAGGATLAQAPGSARFPGMPQSASAEGAVGRELPLKELARALAFLGPRHELAPSPSSEEPDFASEPEAMARLFHLLKAAGGVDFSQYKPTTIYRRLTRRMLHCRMARLPDYVTWLESHPAELDALRHDLLIHVTSFFRDPETFEALARDVIPELLRGRDTHAPLRVWVPGCATGEEAYSVTICFLEAMAGITPAPGLQVFATDLSEAAIERARAGLYPDSITDHVSPERLRRFFVKVDGGYQVAKRVRGLCIFARQDLVSNPPFSRMDLISCRNVFIYLGPALQRKVLATLHYALNPRGFLVLGSSESVGPASDLFSLHDKRHKVYRKKGVTPRSGFFLARVEAPHPQHAEALPPELAVAAPDPQREADRIVLAQYGPPGVIVNDALEIMNFRGHTGAYLEPMPGAASLQLLKMAREELSLELRAALRQVKRQGSRVRRERILLREGPHERRINIDVRPLRASSGGHERYFLILFEEAPEPPSRAEAPRVRGVKGRVHPEVRQLREELAATREHLQALLDDQETAHEELRVANEESQSTNEELQSTNEELETAKEELQATNEELTTVNEELESRNQELIQVNSDLNNLLGSTHIATVMVGGDLRIRRFTPMAESLLKLSPGDMGRPLVDVHSPLLPADLGAVITQVTETLATIERDVQDAEGHWFQLRLRPYKTVDSRIEGAVMTVLDVDRLKRSLEEAQQARELAHAILDTLREPFLLLDGALRVVFANPAFYQAFQVTREQTQGRRVYELGNGQWNIPRLRDLLEEILPRDLWLRDFPVEHAFENIGARRMLLNARRLIGESLAPGRILLSIEDVTGRT
ncbi:PAS domain-containing protein [Pyxidicoccus parkwayensis]|uniref:protein-glutamate O-methyltransferase n=1 Tax=Pyxidicoccus parkwayensis TaxID=2813578 RepID=A0ABX7P6C9_9BACT|nr:chemotaxis protein CheB [Pyxidicoccus parkwaysis]QSQ26018.1 PAS domain-containing protein [Pyxidicoccus parkwaysis]